MLIAGSVRSLTRNAVPPVRTAIPFAVDGVSCIRPIAPERDRAPAWNFDSW